MKDPNFNPQFNTAHNQHLVESVRLSSFHVNECSRSPLRVNRQWDFILSCRADANVDGEQTNMKNQFQEQLKVLQLITEPQISLHQAPTLQLQFGREQSLNQRRLMHERFSLVVKFETCLLKSQDNQDQHTVASFVTNTMLTQTTTTFHIVQFDAMGMITLSP